MNRSDAEIRERKRRVAQALFLWQGVLLIGIVTIVALVAWHLRRRARIIREKFRPRRFPDSSLEAYESISSDEPTSPASPASRSE